MSIKQVEVGAERYVACTPGQFDQKNEMFKRPVWDPALKSLFQKFYMNECEPRDTPGYQHHEMACANASWYLDSLATRNLYKEHAGLYAWDWDGKFNFPRMRSGLKASMDDPAAVTHAVKKTAGLFGACLTGICKLDRRWLYSSGYFVTREGGKPVEIDIPDNMTHVIVVAVPMDYESMRTSPTAPASAATGAGYSRMAFTAGLLGQYIRGLGYTALACGNDTGCSIPMAIDAGLGELARNGLLITPQYGPRVRLAKIITDLPLIVDTPIEFGVWEFCKVCKKCAAECPSKAIPESDTTTDTHNISNRTGLNRWPVNAEKCLSFWAANKTDCSNCIRSCPFNKPAGFLHDAVRCGISRMPWLNRLFLWGDDLCGYGRQLPADKFWQQHESTEIS
jgi:epoxyqueuosine reductase